ncbi:MAG: Bax inhibitor-1/YccA family protein [Oscillospiraceae bacterium]|nr:Bax inhibitor-1/YccA family protein [Oscillospiraceae bacterium]
MGFNNNPYGQVPEQQQAPRELFPSLWGNQEDLDRATTSCLARVFMRMFLALLVTAVVSFGIYQTPGALEYLISNPILTIGMIIAQFVLVMILAFRVMKMSPAVSNVMFFVYAILMGVTLSFIFISYELGTIFYAFAISALMFGAMAIYGTITKRDLTRIGTFLRMALIGLIIASVVNIFFRNDTMMMIINYAGVLIFVGLTAYDTQRIKNMLAQASAENAEEAIKKISVMGALILYLDFINLFLKILAIMGRKR